MRLLHHHGDDNEFGSCESGVLAHDAGHDVLRSPRHATDGLMTSLQFADDLVPRRGVASC
jgi:hypothetical protein